MNSFLGRAAIFTMVMVGFAITGFNGVSQLVDVKLGNCESHYRNYLLRPFLQPVYCAILRIKPCGDFTDHRNMVQHIQMYECLCRDPQANVAHLRTYSRENLPIDNGGSDPEQICFRRPRTHTM